MQASSSKISAQEGRLFSWVQMTNTVCADTKQLSAALRLTPIQCHKLLDRMNQRGIITQLQRGLYLFPAKLPPGGKWQPTLDLAVWYFLTAKKAQWQETGITAFNFYGLSEQIANQTTIYNDKVSAVRKFGRLSVTFIKVPPNRIGDAVEIDSPDNPQIKRKIGSLARVIFDAVYDYSRFGTLPKAFAWIAAKKKDQRFLRELVSSVAQYGNIASCRRMGWLLEKLEVDKEIIQPLKKKIGATSSFIPADPTASKKGKSNMTWNVVENYIR